MGQVRWKKMIKINPAQPGNGIDKRIEPLLPEFGYAADVGANNGLFLSNTKLFEDKGWYVLCIEPNPLLAEEGRRNRKLWRQVACGDRDGEILDFYAVGDPPYGSESGFHNDQVSTVIKQRFPVSAHQLDALLHHSGFPRLDLLCIDVERHEMQVLKGISLDFWKPKIIVAESQSDPESKQMDDYLNPRGYDYIFTQELDRCYQRRV